ncbi:MAG TPA: antibiotic biosynthesis monooxygenase, partial [Stellaceae bacterium]
MARGSLLGLILAAMLSMVAPPAAAQAPTPANPPAPAPAPLTGPVYLISFFETAPAAAQKAAGALRDYVSATRKSDGNTGAVALAETARPDRFALVEVWRDKPAAEAHGKALAALRDSVQALLVAPFDTRFNGGLDVAGPAVGAETAAGGTSVYVLTHVDVFPAGKDQTIEMLKQLAADSRKEPGNLR